jgi:mono/diheme cytochrome c family protein
MIATGLLANQQMAFTKTAAPMRPLDAKATAKLVALGKQISQQKGCNGCHGANLAGKPNFSPSLRSNGVLKEYNPKTWARVMDVGITEDGHKVKKPMPVYRMKAPDSAALYAYYKTLK